MAAYRLRPDGITEIVRQRASSRTRKALSTLGAVVSLSLLPGTVLAVFFALGLPVVVVAMLAMLVAVAWLSGRSTTSPRSEPVLRLAHAAHGREARSPARAP